MMYKGRSSKMIMCLGVFIICSILTLTTVYGDISDTETLYSIGDTMVSLNDPLSNYGGYTEMIVSKSTNVFEGSYDAYLKFDLTELPEGTIVESAVLKLLASEGKVTQIVSVYSCGNQQWDEYTANWIDFQDLPLEKQDTVTIPGLKEFEWDITEAVKKSLSFDSFTLKVATDSWGSGYVKFYSKEGETLDTFWTMEWPRISVSYTVPDITNPVIEEGKYSPSNPDEDDTIYCEAKITDTESEIEDAYVWYKVNGGSLKKVSMSYDSEDEVYFAGIPEQEAGTTINFGYMATDSSGNSAENYDTEIVIEEKASIPSFPTWSIILGILVSALIVSKTK
jgi:hypothetical protein